MKKKNIWLLFVICIALLLVSCKNKKEENCVNNTFYSGFEMNDDKLLGTNIKEYDLDELKSFFGGSNANESIGFGLNIPALVFSEVNYKFPIEILRTGGYSVYRVRQGGYFYVFWIKSFEAGANQIQREPSVYFSAYLSSDIAPELFNSLTPGVSTAEDVKKIDQSFELSFLISNGIFSYSYIDDKTVLQIEYECNENIDGYDDLIVKEKMIVPRTSAPTRYSSILSSDLP